MDYGGASITKDPLRFASVHSIEAWTQAHSMCPGKTGNEKHVLAKIIDILLLGLIVFKVNHKLFS